jgi:hypothetical protein
MINSILNIFFSILKAHLVIVVILGITYFIEKLTSISLFVDQFKWKKSQKNARILLAGDTVYYFMCNLFMFSYDAFKGNLQFNFFTVSLWIIIIVILIKLFRKYHYKYQGMDQMKSDDDYS